MPLKIYGVFWARWFLYQTYYWSGQRRNFENRPKSINIILDKVTNARKLADYYFRIARGKNSIADW